MKIADCTASQVRSILGPYEGGISADAVKASEITGKYGNPFSAVVKDVLGKENTVVIVNLAADDAQASINDYLVENHSDKINAAVEALVEAVNARDVFILTTPEISFECKGFKANIVVADRCLVYREESALYHRIETGELRSCPQEKDFLSEGYQNRPTVTVDAETLCKLYATTRPDYADSKLIVVKEGGTKLLAEFKVGTQISAILEELGCKTEKNPLLGGVLGEFLSKDLLSEAVEYTAKWDLLVLFGAKDCLADVTLKLAEAADAESCGKCVLCREGTWHILSILKDVTAGKAKKADLDMILDIGPLIHAGAFCSFGQNMANAFVSSVEKNREELEAHFIKKKCPAGVCKAFAKMVIDPVKCTGCTDCLDECPEDAIEGKKKFIHLIDPDMCDNCGKCAEVCEEGAIVPQDGTIRVPKKLVRVGKFK